MFKNNQKTPSAILNQSEILTIIGEDVELEGNVTSTKTIRIEGKIIGNIQVQKGLILGEKGEIHGNIDTDAAVIYGTLHGNIKVKHLEIKATGAIHGDIKTDSISMELGAQYNGKLEMKSQLKKEQIAPEKTKLKLSAS